MDLNPVSWDMTARLPKLIPLCVCLGVPGSSTGHVLFNPGHTPFGNLQKDRIHPPEKKTLIRSKSKKMSVKSHIVERYNPTKPEEPKKFYPSIKASGRVTTRELVETASEMCSLTSSDLMGAIEIILSIIPKELSKGNTVELGDFGTFWLRTKTEGADTEEEVTPDQINSVLPRFIPGTQFKWLLKRMRFSRN